MTPVLHIVFQHELILCHFQNVFFFQKREGCSFDCGLVNFDQIVCVCPPGNGLDDDGKTCIPYLSGNFSLGTNSVIRKLYSMLIPPGSFFYRKFQLSNQQKSHEV